MAGVKAGTEPLDVAGIASAEHGHVILDGPSGVAITLTPRAAIDTAASLIRAAEEALKQATLGG
jgi:hypothetical protein